MGELFDAVLDVTIIYPDGAPQFWAMCCGQEVRAEIVVQSRVLDKHLVDGDYQNDRGFRREVHQWLTGIWQDKDALIAARTDSRRARYASISLAP